MRISEIKEEYKARDVARAYDGQRFSSLVGRTFDALEKRALRRTLAPIRAELPRASVLDLPCGTGRITELLLDMGFSVTGGDVSPAMIDVARERCARFGDVVSFRCLDLEKLDLPEASFDLVTCIRLFHHLDSPERARALRAIARVARRYVIVNVSFSSGYYRLRRGLKRLLRQGISRTSSSRDEIEREVREAGLRVLSRRFVAPLLSEDLVLVLGR